jgi:hypothetical protein
MASALGLALMCSACGISDAYRYEQKAKDAITGLLLDPTSAEFRNIAQRSGHVCGEVNAKNKVGAFVGFKRFVVDTVDWRGLIDPEFDFSDLLSAEELCSSMRSNSYSSFSAMESVCSGVEEKRRLQAQQNEFDKAWAINCAGSVRQPFRPPLTEENALAFPQANGSEAGRYASNAIDSVVEDSSTGQSPSESNDVSTDIENNAMDETSLDE